mmetsp:Transcript_20894/g.47129  ORF Transcript_20894/g.47129 Transcript_20894/m.47129 type:complete len:165 (-) Transcript_20894:133-627(-)
MFSRRAFLFTTLGAGAAAFHRSAHHPASFQRSLSSLGATKEPCPSTLPGDPSLVLHTNIDLGAGKSAFMASASKALAESLSKPESYVAVCVHDNASLIWAGANTPCALGTVNSLGGITKENNGAIQARITELLAEYDVPANRIYITFHDIPRENMGYNGATFAG